MSSSHHEVKTVGLLDMAKQMAAGAGNADHARVAAHVFNELRLKAVLSRAESERRY